MSALVERADTRHTPESFAATLAAEPGSVLLQSAPGFGSLGSYSCFTAHPFLTFRSWGTRCDCALRSLPWRPAGHDTAAAGTTSQFGSPWAVLDSLMSRYEMPDPSACPFPLGGCFGWWGYDLRTSLEPRFHRRPPDDLDLPDCTLGFHASVVVFDHASHTTWVVSTGLKPDGSRSADLARADADYWHERLASPVSPLPANCQVPGPPRRPGTGNTRPVPPPRSSLSREAFQAAVERARTYIRAGDIYQVNLAQRLSAGFAGNGWQLYQSLCRESPAPFAAFLHSGELQIASSSPELFLKLQGDHILTRPIKGTRPRGNSAESDANLAAELESSIKENAELLMITDLLRNDLGRVCRYGTVQVPELKRLERFAHVQHLVSSVEGRLRPELTHFQALAACFPGGSITGAPKIRAMEIIVTLEPVARGPYTGCHGYLGFNRQSQLSITIRTALLHRGTAHFHTGAGIVADSDPAAEYEETLAKAKAFLGLVDPSLKDPE